MFWTTSWWLHEVVQNVSNTRMPWVWPLSLSVCLSVSPSLNHPPHSHALSFTISLSISILVTPHPFSFSPPRSLPPFYSSSISSLFVFQLNIGRMDGELTSTVHLKKVDVLNFSPEVDVLEIVGNDVTAMISNSTFSNCNTATRMGVVNFSPYFLFTLVLSGKPVVKMMNVLFQDNAARSNNDGMVTFWYCDAFIHNW